MRLPVGRSTDPGAHADRRVAVGVDAAVASLPLLAGVLATWLLLGLPATYVLTGVALYLALSALLVAAAPADLPGRGLGPANRVTLGRAALAIPIVALCLPPTRLDSAGAWWVVALGAAVMALDGVDGRVARRTGSASDFGARFDMELDAALILALSCLVWSSGRAGAWVLLIGAMRYAFLAAALPWPALGAPLPERFRRKAVCVFQGVALLVALGPVIPPSIALASVGLALAALTYSFAVDVAWLITRAGR